MNVFKWLVFGVVIFFQMTSSFCSSQGVVPAPSPTAANSLMTIAADIQVPSITPDPMPLSFNDFEIASTFSPDNRQYVTLSTTIEDNYPKKMRIWDAKDGTLIKTVEAGAKSFGSGIGYSWDGSAVFTVLDNQPIRIWNAKTWALLSEIPIPEKGKVEGFAVHPKLPQLTISVGNGTYILNANTGKIIKKMAESYGSVSYSSDGSMLAVMQDSGFTSVRIIDTYHLKTVASINTGQVFKPRLSWNPSGTQIAVISTPYPSILRVYDLKGREVFTLKTYAFTFVGKPRWSPDGSVLAIATLGRVFFLNPQTGQILAQVWTKEKSADDLVFSPDGNMIGTGSYIIRMPEGVSATVKRVVSQQSVISQPIVSQIVIDQLAKIEPLCDSEQLNFAECTLVRRAIETQNFVEIPALLRYLNGEINLKEFIRLLRA
jgi:WD40 repeat protein